MEFFFPFVRFIWQRGEKYFPSLAQWPPVFTVPLPARFFSLFITFSPIFRFILCCFYFYFNPSFLTVSISALSLFLLFFYCLPLSATSSYVSSIPPSLSLSNPAPYRLALLSHNRSLHSGCLPLPPPPIVCALTSRLTPLCILLATRQQEGGASCHKLAMRQAPPTYPLHLHCCLRSPLRHLPRLRFLHPRPLPPSPEKQHNLIAIKHNLIKHETINFHLHVSATKSTVVCYSWIRAKILFLRKNI